MRKNITITLTQLGSTKQQITLVADVEGELAVHPAFDTLGWAVTHLPTGLHCGVYPNESAALAFRALVTDLVDWKKVGFKDGKATGLSSEMAAQLIKLKKICTAG